MSTIKFLLILIFFPILLIFWIGWNIYWKFFGENSLSFKKLKKQKTQKEEFRKKWSEHLRNFSPGRVKNRRWRAVLGKEKSKNLINERQNCQKVQRQRLLYSLKRRNNS